MERDSPEQYRLYLADKAAATSWREMQRQNEQSRNGRPADGVEMKSAVEAERVALSNIWSDGGESSDDRAPSSPSSRPEDINLSSWGTLGRTESKPSAFTSPPNNSSDDTISSGKTSIFSTISQKANAFNSNPDNATRTTDLLSELFTTTPNKAPPPEPHSAMIYSPNHWENYHEAITSVLSDSKTEKIFDKMEAKGALEKKCVQLVKDWLLSDRRVVEKDVVGDRWKRLDEMWRGGWESGASSIFNRDGGEVETESTGTDEGGEAGELTVLSDEGNGAEEESKLLLELKTQREVFIDKLLNNAVFDADNEPNEQPEESEEFTSVELSSKFYPLAVQIMSFLGRYCARRARSSPMEVAWFKVKESGMKLPKDSISTYLYVVSTMGTANSLGLSSGFGDGRSLFSNNAAEKDDDAENSAIIIPEEVVTYHDLLSQPTESSISIRVKALAAKGDVKTAEELLEAFKVSLQLSGMKGYFELN